MPEIPISLPSVLSLGSTGLVARLSAGSVDFERFPELADGAVPVISVEVAALDSVGPAICEASFYLYRARAGSFEEIWVNPAWRRKGVATSVYDLMERLGIEVSPSSELDEDGQLFWAARKISGSISTVQMQA